MFIDDKDGLDTHQWNLNFTDIIRAFPIGCLKFKLKFDLRLYFFHFSLSLFKTFVSDFLFSILFHLNIHSSFIFFFFFISSKSHIYIYI